MNTIGYVRVSTDGQVERGCSLEAQAEKTRAMALVQGAQLDDIIIESGESAKSLNRTGMAKLLALVDAGKVKVVIVAKLDRLTRSVKDLCELLERFERKGVSLVSVADAGYRLGRRAAGAEHHGGGFAMGAGSDRGADPGCAPP
jgi:site-specific DNA recombinase